MDTCSSCGACVGEWHYADCYENGTAKQGERYTGRVTEQVMIKGKNGSVIRGYVMPNPCFWKDDLMDRLAALEKSEIREQLLGRPNVALEQAMAADPEFADAVQSEYATASLKDLIADWQMRLGISHWNVRITLTDPEFDTEWELQP